MAILGPFIDLTTTRPEHDIADIFRQHWRAYQRRYGLSQREWSVVWNIIRCRTAALGGFMEQCDTCGKLRIAYRSCRDRHCPKCGAWEKAQWLREQEKLLLPIPYFHIVFTTDHALNPVIRANQKALYDLLFHTATATLKEYGQQYLAGELGITAVLHTWGQQLQEHVHLHTLVTGGALGHTAGKWHWRASAENFLFPIVAVSATFRDKFCAGVLRLYEQGGLTIPAGLDVPTLVAQMQAQNWEVYVRVARDRETDGGAAQVLDYFGRYTNRIAISNYRLTRITPWKVTFRYYDNRAGGVAKELTLGVLEFMRRFLQHVLPKGYMRIRHYGLHHNRKRGALSMARKLLGLTVRLPEPPPLERERWLAEILAVEPQRCPFCSTGTMVAWRPFGAIQGVRALAWQVLGLDLRGAVSR
jgi:hypothetical protein